MAESKVSSPSSVQSGGKHTPGPWREGKWGASIVSDSPVSGGIPGSDEIDYYGGYLIAESIAPCNRPLIAAAPEMYETLQVIARGVTSDGAVILAKQVIAKAEGR